MLKEESRFFGKLILGDNKVVDGVWLYITDDVIYLEVPLKVLIDDRIPLIKGAFNNFGNVSFFNCYLGGGETGVGGGYRRIIVGYMLKGGIYNSLSDLRFNLLQFESQTLVSWINDYDTLFPFDDTNVSVEFPKQKNILNVEYQGFAISITIGRDSKSSPHRYVSNKKCFISIRTNEAVHLDDFLDLKLKIENFILFVTNKDPHFSKCVLIEEQRSYVELINVSGNVKENKLPHNIRLSYIDIESDFKTVFYNWVSNDEVRTVIDLILEKCYNTELSPQGFFLNMCVAIECYHDKFIKNDTSEDIAERLEKREMISQLIDNEELRSWFRQKSNFWTRPDMRDKLMAFEQVFKVIHGEVFPYTTKKLIDKILKTRNTMAHDGAFDKYLSRIELVILGKVLEYTLKVELLKLLGINKNVVDSLIEESRNNVESLAKWNEYNVK
ncbi:HEPN domain-containing protein [Limibacter armeniacum]|uniref:ApeA N-terminal domain 1-containing protein n=1 Tax=Limibacter armeniacum TaxID=466084 RepID=UPI002FE50FFD